MRTEVVRNILREQVDERLEIAKEVYHLYLDEMKALIKNPNARPDTSSLKRFIENETGTFGRELAKVFADAIEAGYCHASEMAERKVKENAIPGAVCLADVPPLHDKAMEFWQMFEGMLVKGDTARFDKYVDLDFHEYSEKYPDAEDQLRNVYKYVMKKRVQWFS